MRRPSRVLVPLGASLLSALGLVSAACTSQIEPPAAATPVVVERVVTATPGPSPTPVVIERIVERVITPAAAPVVTKAAPTATPTPGVLRIGIAEDITTTNVWAILGPQVTAWNFYTQLHRYPRLYRLSDLRLDWVPAAASGFPTDFVQEGDLWTTTVTLKGGMTWSDGRPVTAEDVAFTVDTVLALQLPGNWPDLIDPNVVAGAEALDARTVKFSFHAPPGLARWQYGLAMAPFVAKHFWEPLVAQARRANTLEAQRQALFAVQPRDEPTAGEMLLVRWEKGAFIELKANERYFFKGSRVVEYANGAYVEELPGVYREVAYGEPEGEVLLEFTRGPFVSSAIFSVYPSQDAAVLALRAEEIDYLLSPTGIQRGLQRQLAGHGGVKVLTNASNGVNYLGFNMRRPPMDSLAFRRAVAVLIDKEFVTQAVLQGVADPAYTIVPPGNQAWHNASVPRPGAGLAREERIAEAVRLLTQAGFTFEVPPVWDAERGAVRPGKGLRTPDGTLVPELELVTPNAAFDPLLTTFAIWTEQWLQEAGIPVRAEATPFNEVVARYFQQDFDMWILGLGFGLFPDYLYAFFHSERAGDANAAGYANPDYDALAGRLIAETDLAAAQETAFQLQEILAEDVPYVFLFTTQLQEPLRAEVDLPYPGALSGLQDYFQYINGPLSFLRLE